MSYTCGPIWTHPVAAWVGILLDHMYSPLPVASVQWSVLFSILCSNSSSSSFEHFWLAGFRLVGMEVVVVRCGPGFQRGFGLFSCVNGIIHESALL